MRMRARAPPGTLDTFTAFVGGHTPPRCGGKFEVSSCCKGLDKLRSVKRFTYEMLGLLATVPLGLSFLAPTTHEDDAPAEWQRVRLKIERTNV